MPPRRSLYLIHGEDPYRARLRAAELVASLVTRDERSSDLRTQRSSDLGTPLGLSRYDATDKDKDVGSLIELSGRSQGLFDAVDEQRIVVVEHAEALKDTAVIGRFPAEAALVLVSETKIQAQRRRPAKTAKTAKVAEPVADLATAVEAAGGSIEHIARLLPGELGGWIAARATLLGIDLGPDAIVELGAAVGPDSERVDQELAKLGSFAAGARVTGADVRALVSGAIESDIFELTQSVVRRDSQTAIARLDALLAEGQAPQQILALLLWQFRVLLFAVLMNQGANAERSAKAIRSSAYAIGKWQAFARRVSRADIVRAYEVLYATDLAIKTGRIEEKLAMTLCVLDLCGVHAADPRELVVGEPPRR
ncbi:MAG TPA: DNA polymerase III subunit delta [Candidatus Limnocylindria bacterium]|nr:DNA polymerase III subunit delta [Candidatus Limnocylindria bacterium]